MLNKLIFSLVFFLFFFTAYAFPGNSIYNLDLNLVDKDGKNIRLSDLSGNVYVFSMIYTNCKTICPIIIANMKIIEKFVLSEKIDNVKFALVSLDPEKDSLEKLNDFFKKKKMNNNFWNIYKTTKADTLKLALSLGIKYKKEKNNEYTHSNLIIILDKDGVIKMHHQGLDKNFYNLVNLLHKLS